MGSTVSGGKPTRGGIPSEEWVSVSNKGSYTFTGPDSSSIAAAESELAEVILDLREIAETSRLAKYALAHAEAARAKLLTIRWQATFSVAVDEPVKQRPNRRPVKRVRARK